MFHVLPGIGIRYLVNPGLEIPTSRLSTRSFGPRILRIPGRGVDFSFSYNIGAPRGSYDHETIHSPGLGSDG